MGLELEFIDQEISSWGGVSILKKLLDTSGFSGYLDQLALPPQGSNRGYPPVQLFTQFMTSVWCGANRYVHLDVARFDESLQRLFGWDKMPEHKAFERYFDKFDIPTSYTVFGGLYRWFFTNLKFYNDLDSLIQMRVWAMDMLLNIDIDENVKATLNLSESGNNRIELIGGGALAYSMNTQGDRRLSGRYVLSGGKVIYHPPIISTKEFEITDGSYVEWTGEMLNPSFNINAVERLKTTVTTATGTGSALFDVAVIISNKLDDMSMRLDLSSPGELQTDIASLTPEERSAQAMSLLLYNTLHWPRSYGQGGC